MEDQLGFGRDASTNADGDQDNVSVAVCVAYFHRRIIAAPRMNHISARFEGHISGDELKWDIDFDVARDLCA
jgi:hypothetical protein